MSFINSHIRLLLFLAIFIGAILRLYSLETIPPGLHADEALTGYTAYSILKTGKDLLGENNFTSFNDTNIGGVYPSLLSWLLVPFVAVFGLEIYVDRLPSALLGIASILLLFAIVKELTKNEKIALISAFFIAINPAAIHISRQGLLQSIGLFTVLIGIYLFLLGGRNSKLFLLSSFVLGLSLYAYDAPRLFLPLMLIPLTAYNWKFILKAKKIFIYSIIVFSLFYGYFLYQIVFQNEIGEYTRSNIINMQDVAELVNTERYQTTAPLWISQLFHNKATVIFKIIATNYVDILSVNWFYVNGPADFQASTGKQGRFYLFELPLAIAGLYYLYKNHRKVFYVLILWVLLAILPGAFSKPTPNRLSLLIPVPLIFSAAGLYVVLHSISKLKQIKKLAAICIIFITMGVFLTSYLFTYFFDYPVYASEFWGKQQNDAIKYAIENKDKYESVYLDGGMSWASQYAFITKLDPYIFQQAVTKPTVYRNVTTYKFDNIHFGIYPHYRLEMPCAYEFFPGNSLVITIGENDIFAGEEPVKHFYDRGNLRSVFKAIETKTPETSACEAEKDIVF
jgi:4-amino-4-deoxy-L-arabinose transferase-like glycosyltransferase